MNVSLLYCNSLLVTSRKLVNYPDDDPDSSQIMSVMNDVINTFHTHSFVGLVE